MAWTKRHIQELGKPHIVSCESFFTRPDAEYPDRERVSYGVADHAEYFEVGKAHYMGKDLTGVRSPQRKRMPDNAGLDTHEPTSLRGRALTASLNKEHRFRNLYGELTPECLLTAWTRINKDAASGVEKITAKEYRCDLVSNIESLAQRVKEKTYTAKLVRRTYIPKENGTERPLGIPALEDKIVQRAVAMLVDAIYEQDFLDVSYGYRVNKSANDAVGDLTFQ